MSDEACPPGRGRYTMDEKKMIAITAHMEGQAAIIKTIGDKHEVSDMELMCLCNFAEIGVLSIFSVLGGMTSDKAAAHRDELIAAIRRTFATEQNPDGLNSLAQSCMALLRSPRFQRYIIYIPVEDEPEETADGA